jgi:hypothetical protein
MSRREHREYPLPFHLEALHSAEGLDPWLARFDDRTADEVAEILRGEWEALTTPVVASFRDAILRFQPISLFHTDEEWYRAWWLRMHRSRTDTPWEKEVFLHAPPDHATLDGCLARHGLPKSLP